MDGDGCIFRYIDGGLFVGSYRNNKKEGQGVYTWPDGAVFEGEFKVTRLLLFWFVLKFFI